MQPRGTLRGTVLLSYTTLPFIDTRPEIFDGHTNRWECRTMAEIFLERGYAVDIIDFDNESFIPKKPYTFFIDVETNLERIAPYLNSDCIKIFHITTSHWKFNNKAEKERLESLAKRKGIRLPPERMLKPNQSAEKADILLLLGNAFTEATYKHLKKPIFHIPISTTFTYPFQENKNFEIARYSFIWIGGAGPVHKGVDLLLEAFAEMPEYHLHLCGKVSDPGFEKIYFRELHQLPNITTHDVLNLGGSEFRKIVETSVATISPSCAEGQSGSVIVGMHAGLIPIVSKESGVDTFDFGITLQETSIESIKKAVCTVASSSPYSLHTRASTAWRHVQSKHTRENFAETFSHFIDKLEFQITTKY